MAVGAESEREKCWKWRDFMETHGMREGGGAGKSLWQGLTGGRCSSGIGGRSGRRKRGFFGEMAVDEEVVPDKSLAVAEGRQAGVGAERRGFGVGLDSAVGAAHGVRQGGGGGGVAEDGGKIERFWKTGSRKAGGCDILSRPDGLARLEAAPPNRMGSTRL